MRLSREGRILAETTSMKGVPRAVKATHLPIKLLWIAGVLCFLTVAVYQTTCLILDFLRYPTVTSVDKDRVDLATTDAIQLPDLLICNLNPLSERMYSNDTIPSIEDYLTLVDTIISESHDNMDVSKMESVKKYFRSVRGYYAFIGPEQAKIVGHAREEFIVSCKILMLFGMQTSEVDCGDAGSVRLLQHPQYFNCYTISMGSQTQTAVKVGYSLTLHLNNFNTSWHEQLNDTTAFQLGAMITLQAPNTYPNFLEAGHHVAPGSHVDLKFQLEKLNKLTNPYGQCITQEEADKVLDKYTHPHLNYTPAVCVNCEIHERILSQCNCSDLTRFELIQDGKDTSCSMRGKTPIEAIEAALCVEAVMNEVNFAVTTQCPIPCEETQYAPAYSRSTWPADSLSWTFYESVIEGKPYEHRYMEVKKILTQGQATDAINQLIAERLVVRNFLTVRTYLAQQLVFNITETPKHTLIGLISQMGGTLNLWSGITMILIVEFLEFLVKLLMRTDEAPSGGEATSGRTEKIEFQPVHANDETAVVDA